MNELVTQHKETKLAISTETKKLIQSSIADSTLKRYRRLSKQIEAWLGGQMLNDPLLARYITEFINLLPRILLLQRGLKISRLTNAEDSTMNIYEELGVRTLINAAGTVHPIRWLPDGTRSIGQYAPRISTVLFFR